MQCAREKMRGDGLEEKMKWRHWRAEEDEAEDSRNQA